MSDFKTQCVESARAAVAAHTAAARIDDEGSPHIALYHLLANLMEFCDAENLDFDALVSEVRADANL